MPAVNVIVALYALLSIGLGFYGYLEKGSVISLIAGGVAGLLLLGSLALVKTNPRVARIGAAVIALLMLGQMGRSAMKEPKWHTVTMAVASLIVVVVLVGAHFMQVAKRKAETNL
jgi:uncharacterized membrane protein (UPF0136 family)